MRGLLTDVVPSFRAIAESPVEEHVTELTARLPRPTLIDYSPPADTAYANAEQ